MTELESTAAKWESVHRRITLSNGRILCILAFSQGIIAGWGFAQRTARPLLALVLTVGPVSLVGFLLWAYTQTDGLFGGLIRRGANRAVGDGGPREH